MGDCARNFDVVVNELVTGVAISLDHLPMRECLAFDPSGNGRVSVDELVLGVRNSLHGCP